MPCDLIKLQHIVFFGSSWLLQEVGKQFGEAVQAGVQTQECKPSSPVDLLAFNRASLYPEPAGSPSARAMLILFPGESPGLRDPQGECSRYNYSQMAECF